jgi:RNA ligase (TIGR02306 family)
MSSLIVEVVRIGEIVKHPNADTLSMTTVKDWNCIFKDGHLATGDLAIYIPVDAVLPGDMVEKYELEYLKNGARVRSVKLRQVLSQGLLLRVPDSYRFREGQNVADALGITKWEPPTAVYQGSPRQSTKLRPNPNFSRYCDPENIKNFPRVFQDGEMVVVTEKIHGTNFRAGNVERNWGKGWLARAKRFLFGRWLGGYEFCVGSRNVHLVGENPNFYGAKNPYWDIAKRYKLSTILPKGFTLYGEIYGAGIQDLTYGLKGTDVVFFDLKRGEDYVDQDEFRSFCTAYGLPIAPVLYCGAFLEGMADELATGKSLLAAGQMREGCVVRPLKEAQDYWVGRKILKALNPEYLLRKDGTEYH